MDNFFSDLQPPEDLLIKWGKEYENKKEEREQARIKTIQYWFDELAEDDETRMGLIELIEACDGDVPFDVGICTACGSDEGRYTSHYNNNAECS